MAYNQIKTQTSVTAGHKTAVDFVEIGTGGILASLVIPANGIVTLRDSHDYQNFPTGIVLQVGASTYTHVAITWAVDGKSWTAPTLTTGQFYYDPDYGNVVCSTADQNKTITQLTIKSIGTRIRASIVNTLLQNDKDIVTGLEVAEGNIATLQGINAGARLTALEGINAGSRLTAIEGVNASTRLTTLEGINAGSRLNALEAAPATVEVFLTSSSGNLTAANAPTYKIALVLTDPAELWTSDGTSWTQRNLGGSGGFNYSPKINGFGLKPNSVSANGWTIQVTSISDNESDPINGKVIVDGVDYQTLASIALAIPLEWAVTGQAVGTHSCILKIFDEAHPGGVSATVTVKLVLPTSTLTATATKSQMIVSGTTDIATQATITKIRVAYRLQGTDADANAAVTAGRYFDLTAGADITAFQGAGYTKTGLSLTPGTTYIPSVQVTANTGTGASQTGGWTAGSSMLIDPAPTAPVISASVNTSGNVTVTLTTPSTDATPETPTYDIAVWDSVGTVWVAKQTGIAANSPYLTGTGLGTSYAAGTSLQVRVTAKDAHGNATDSNIVSLTVNQAPVVSGLTLSNLTGTGFTVKGTITDLEGNATTEVNVVWSTNNGDNPDTLFAGTNKAAYTLGTDITNFTGSGVAISATLTSNTTLYCWARAKDATGTGEWVQTNAVVPDVNTLLSDGFEGTIDAARVTVGGTNSVSFSTTSPISGSQSLVCDKADKAYGANYIVAYPSTSENFIRASVKFRIDRMPTAGTGVANLASLGKEYGLPFWTVVNNSAGQNAIQIGLSPDGYLLSSISGDSTNWKLYATPLTAGTTYTLETTYNRSTKATTITLNGTTVRTATATSAGVAASFDQIILHNGGVGNYTGKITYDDFLMKKV